MRRIPKKGLILHPDSPRGSRSGPIRPIRPLAVLLTAALCLPALRTAAQTVTLPTCGEPASAAAYVPETDTLLLTVERLLELGGENSLRLRADRLDEEASGDRTRTARTERLPEVNVGLKGGFVGQPVVFEHGLSDATYPDAPALIAELQKNKPCGKTILIKGSNGIKLNTVVDYL